MPLYQVSAETSKKLDAVAEALGVKYHDEAIEILISAAHRVTVITRDSGELHAELAKVESMQRSGKNGNPLTLISLEKRRNRLLASIAKLDAK